MRKINFETTERPPENIITKKNGQNVIDTNSITRIFVQDGIGKAFLQRNEDKTYLYLISNGRICFYRVDRDSREKFDRTTDEVISKDGIVIEEDGRLIGFLNRSEEVFYFLDKKVKVRLREPKVLEICEEKVKIIQILLGDTVS